MDLSRDWLRGLQGQQRRPWQERQWRYGDTASSAKIEVGTSDTSEIFLAKWALNSRVFETGHIAKSRVGIYSNSKWADHM